MFLTALGVKVPFPEQIKEEYQIRENSIRFQLSFEKLEPLLAEFLAQLEEPLFLALHLPLSKQEELELLPPGTEKMTGIHDKVCYLDGQSREDMQAILREYGELLLNDGLSQFAVASHNTGDELFIMKYKIAVIFCKNPQKYCAMLEAYGAVRTDELRTVWDTFSEETPGHAQRIEMNGITAYKIFETLAEKGMYQAKIVEAEHSAHYESGRE